MIKEVSIEIGGRERKLKFGTMGFFDHVGEVFGGDPLELLTISNNPKRQYEMTVACIYAGLKCAGETVTKEEVNKMVYDLEITEAAKVIKVVEEVIVGGNGKPGETIARELVESA